MISIRIDASNIDDLVGELVRFGNEGKREIARAVAAATEKARDKAIKNVQRGAKTGVVYHRASGNGVSSTHQASAAGESPATDTGRLVGSITSDPRKGLVMSELDYAFWLEYGTRHIEPRPFLTPAVMSVRPYFIDQLQKGILRAAGRAGL